MKIYKTQQVTTSQIQEYLVDVQGYGAEDFEGKGHVELLNMVDNLNSFKRWFDIDNKPV